MGKNLRNPMMNMLVIQGRIVRNPELQHMPSGGAVCRFSIANEYRTKKENGFETSTSFFDAVAWGKMAELVAQCHKGDDIQIVGKLRQETYQVQQSERTRICIHCDNIQLMAWPETERQETQPRQQRIGHSGEESAPPEPHPEDEIPF